VIRAVAGVRGQISDWAWETSLHRSESSDVTVRTNSVDPARVADALSATDVDEALNPFGANSPELLESLLAPPAESRFGTQMLQAAAHLRGSLVTLPAGDVELVVGGERRNEQVRYDMRVGPPLSGAHQRFVTAAFGEISVPLVGEKAQVPAVFDLSLVLSGRFDDYSDVGASFNPEYALVWRPIPALTLRTSLSQSFRPPPLFDLYMPLLDQVLPTADPARNNEIAFPIWRVGGNPNLKPATAEAFTSGLRFAPATSAGLRIDASYWRISVDETIGIPAGERLLAAAASFSDRIVRGEPSAADVAAGMPGPLQMIDVTRLNYGSIRTSGVDFAASMDIDTRAGRFIPEFSATWVRDFTTTDLVEGPDVDRVGLADLQGTVARWRGVAGFAWIRAGVTLSTNARYVPSYDDVDVPGHRTGRSVRAQTLIDAQVAFDLSDMIGAESAWQGFELRAGALNLLNEEPSFAEAGLLTGYDPSQGDLRQRFVYLKLSKRF
jgi:iron complex outermembrane receptor protein